MKKLLLTSAIVAVSGAAFAEITWSGDAEIGLRSHSNKGWVLNGKVNETPADLLAAKKAGTLTEDQKKLLETYDAPDANPFYFEADLNATATAELDYGITAELDYGMSLDYGIAAGNHNANGWVTNEKGEKTALKGVVKLDAFPTLTLTSSYGTLVLGDINHAANEKVGDQSSILDDYFDENDGGFVARTDTTVAGFGLAASTAISNSTRLADTKELIGFTDALGNNIAGKKNLGVGDFSIAATGDLFGVSGVLAYETRGEDSSVAGVARYTTAMGIYGTVGAASAALDTDGDMKLDADKRTWAVQAGYKLEGIDLSAEVAGNKLDRRGVETEWTSYEISADFNMFGADATLTYKDKNTDVDTKGNQGFAIDVAYEVLDGVTVLAGYDETVKQVIGDKKGELGASYVGTSYSLGGGAEVFASWSNAHEMGDPEYNVGTTLGVSFEF